MTELLYFAVAGGFWVLVVCFLVSLGRAAGRGDELAERILADRVPGRGCYPPPDDVPPFVGYVSFELAELQAQLEADELEEQLEAEDENDIEAFVHELDAWGHR